MTAHESGHAFGLDHVSERKRAKLTMSRLNTVARICIQEVPPILLRSAR